MREDELYKEMMLKSKQFEWINNIAPNLWFNAEYSIDLFDFDNSLEDYKKLKEEIKSGVAVDVAHIMGIIIKDDLVKDMLAGGIWVPTSTSETKEHVKGINSISPQETHAVVPLDYLAFAVELLRKMNTNNYVYLDIITKDNSGLLRLKTENMDIIIAGADETMIDMGKFGDENDKKERVDNRKGE